MRRSTTPIVKTAPTRAEKKDESVKVYRIRHTTEYWPFEYIVLEHDTEKVVALFPTIRGAADYVNYLGGTSIKEST